MSKMKRQSKVSLSDEATELLSRLTPGDRNEFVDALIKRTARVYGALPPRVAFDLLDWLRAPRK